jgi:hypothetical protein
MEDESMIESQLLGDNIYRVPAETFWQASQALGEDGYDRIETSGKHGWTAIASWGSDGWDLGNWPYVVISHRHTTEGHELAYNVEGDIAVYRYPTPELLNAATDCLAFFHWGGQPWVAGVDSADAMPDRLRGPYSSSRQPFGFSQVPGIANR